MIDRKLRENLGLAFFNVRKKNSREGKTEKRRFASFLNLEQTALWYDVPQEQRFNACSIIECSESTDAPMMVKLVVA